MNKKTNQNKQIGDNVSNSPLWRKGDGSEVPMDELNPEELEDAYFTAIKQMGYHAGKVQRHQSTMKLFMTKAEELCDEAERRGVDWLEDEDPVLIK